MWGSPWSAPWAPGSFPRLAEDDLYVEPDEIGAFLEECALLVSHVPLIVAGMAHGTARVRAETVGAGVAAMALFTRSGSGVTSVDLVRRRRAWAGRSLEAGCGTDGI